MANPCGKRRVMAVLLTSSGDFYVGENTRKSNRPCPRVDSKSGDGYHHCVKCGQEGHAETKAILAALGDAQNAIGGKMFIFGHTEVCQQCQEAMRDKGIKWRVMK